ncbi:MAG: carboxylesterase family protein [Solobacterium sp.]|nr:carboxylesterase family protein [Solobacterium sp.]
MGIILRILFVFLSVLFAAVLELNRNTLAGWVLFLLLLGGFPVLYKRFLTDQSWILRMLGFLLYPLLFAGILFLSWPPVKNVPAVSVRHPDVTDPIETAYGTITGVYNKDHTVEVFAGIPYAAPPLGELRWRSPQDPSPWEGVLACDSFQPMSMQETSLPIVDSLTQIIGYHDYQISLDDNYRPPVSEDSLYLNIWKPVTEETDLPVLVYIHGGSLQTGQPWYQDYSGEGFAKDGVITVNMGYRLGVFGFLAEEELLEAEGTTGNYGLLDQIKALEWVQDNIRAFGGDPNNVTLVGESAGAVCVDALCVSPLAKGLFQRAILESSTLSSVIPPHSFRRFDEALASGRDLMNRYGCASLDELRSLPAEQLVHEMYTQHHVTVDGYVLSDTPYELRRNGVHNESALLHGYNKEESGPFIIFSRASLSNYEEKLRTEFGDSWEKIKELYPASSDEEADRYWAEIYGAEFFNYSHYCLSRLAKENGIPVYAYYFSKSNGRLSSWHSGELVYAFGVIPEHSTLYQESDYELSRAMHTYWVNFAKTGNPNGDSLPEFREYGTASQLMEFGETTGLIEEPYLNLYDVFDAMQGFEAN